MSNHDAHATSLHVLLRDLASFGSSFDGLLVQSFFCASMATSPLPICSTPLTTCPFCLDAPALQTAHGKTAEVWGLSYVEGLCKIKLHPCHCLQSNWSFLGCWAYPPANDARVRIACHPNDAAWFVFRERLHAGSFVALHREYLHFMTVAFLFLRASFSGLAKTAAAMFPQTMFGANDCLRGLEHGWFLYSSLVAAWEPSMKGSSFDLRLEYLDATLSHYEPLLHSLLTAHAKAHACVHCANPVVAGDGGMKLTTRVCNERTSTVLSSDDLALRVMAGCDCRPRNGSLYCKHHYIPPQPQLSPEIREHKIVNGRITFRYAGEDDFVTLDTVDLIRLRQYDSALSLADYRSQAPTRCASLQAVSGRLAEDLVKTRLWQQVFTPIYYFF